MSKGFETLADIAPENLAADSNAAACIKGIDPYLKAVAEAQETPALYYRLGRLTSAQLDHMARQMDVDVWRDSWSIVKKRSMILASYDVKRKCGTAGAVKTVLRALGATTSMTEWWQTSPKGTPHTFGITVLASSESGNGTLTDDEQEDLIRGIDAAKPVRSHYELTIATVHRGGIGISGNIRHCVYARVGNL